MSSEKQFITNQEQSVESRVGYMDARTVLYGRNNSSPIETQSQDSSYSEMMQPYIRPNEMPSHFRDTAQVAPSRQQTVQPTAHQVQPALQKPIFDKPSLFLGITKKDLEPSAETMLYRDKKNVPQEKKQTETKSKAALDRRTKALVALYIAITAILAVTIIITGIAMSKLNNEVSALELNIVQAQQTLVEQGAELTLLDNDAVIAHRATEIGMVAVGEDTKTVELIEIVEPEQYQTQSNPFDKLRKFLSGIVG